MSYKAFILLIVMEVQMFMGSDFCNPIVSINALMDGLVPMEITTVKRIPSK